MRTSWKPMVMIVALVSGVALLNACGDSSSVTVSTTMMPTATVTATATATMEPSPTAVIKEYCSLVSISEAATATGLPITRTQDEQNTSGTVFVCNYIAPEGNKAAVAGLIYEIFPSASGALAYYNSSKSSGLSVSNIPGLGDAAFSASLPMGTSRYYDVVVLKGNLVLNASVYPDGLANIKAEVKFATLAISKL